MSGTENLTARYDENGKDCGGREWGRTDTQKRVKTKHLHYWEDTTDLVSAADVYPTQVTSQEFSLSRNEIMGSSAQGLGCTLSSRHIIGSNQAE